MNLSRNSNSHLVTPPYLKHGDAIGIVSTARRISPEEVEPAVRILESSGFKVVLGKNIYQQHNQFAGTDSERIADLQEMLDNDSIKAILCARGGYGTVRLVDSIDFSGFVEKPKWVCGYSDVTVLHTHIHRHFGIETLHCTMPLNFPANGVKNNAIQSMVDALTGKKLEYSFPFNNLSRPGNAEGVLVGGNLSILYSLAGSLSDIDTQGKILFIEDLDEYLYHIDRMMMNLKRTGKLEQLAGLVVGGMTDMRDNSVPYGQTAEEIIAETVKDYPYPVCFGFPAGHIENNMALRLGKKMRLDVTKKGCLLSEVW